MPYQLDPAVITSTSSLTVIDKRPVGVTFARNETYTVPASQTIRLREVPAETDPSTVIIPGYTEVPTFPPSAGQFFVNYTSGQVSFDATAIGHNVAVSYNGTGSIVFAEDVNNITSFFAIFYNKLNSIVPDAPATPNFSFPAAVSVTTTTSLGSYTDTTQATLVSGFTSINAGTFWFNSTSNQFCGWSGTSVVILG